MLAELLLKTFAVSVTGYLLSGGVVISNFWVAAIVVVVFSILNLFLKPILILLTLPISIMTFGFFTLVINAFLIMLTAYIVPGFSIVSFWWALLFGIVLSLVNLVVYRGLKHNHRNNC